MQSKPKHTWQANTLFIFSLYQKLVEQEDLARLSSCYLFLQKYLCAVVLQGIGNYGTFR